VIVISEDVWSDEFATLHKTFPITHEPDLWNRRDDLKKLLANADALVVRNRTSVNREIIESAPRLRIIARAGVGLDNIDIACADERGVVVSAALGINAVAVGELTLGLALALLRDVVVRDASTRNGEWNRAAGTEISGKTWGYLGFGATARATSRLISGFGCKEIAYDPYAKDFGKATSRTFDEVISEADIISVHLPATSETMKSINSSTLAKMKTNAILINVGRGEVIDEEALESALRAKKIAGAALDVRAVEPPKDQRFSDLTNVILTPHIAGITRESQQAINQVLVSEIERALKGEPQEHAVGKVKQVQR
jgi:D-3-phosphoglycerate dehydrogenase / 2-oxoglutarate reductase